MAAANASRVFLRAPGDRPGHPACVGATTEPQGAILGSFLKFASSLRCPLPERGDRRLRVQSTTLRVRAREGATREIDLRAHCSDACVPHFVSARRHETTDARSPSAATGCVHKARLSECAPARARLTIDSCAHSGAACAQHSAPARRHEPPNARSPSAATGCVHKARLLEYTPATTRLT